MIKLLLLAVVPFMTQHRNVVPKTEVSTNFYGSVTGIVDKAYIQSRIGTGAVTDVRTNGVSVVTDNIANIIETDPTVPAWAKQPNPPEGIPATGLVWNATSGAVKTANGAKTIGAADVGALPDNQAQLENNDNFKKAVETVSPKVDVVAPTNRADYAGKAADAKATGIALTNRYTKAETDAKLAGKIDKIQRFSVVGTVAVITDDGGLEDSRIKFTKEDSNVWLEDDYFTAKGVSSDSSVNATGDVYAYGDGNEHKLTLKANRPALPVTAGNLAALTADGNLADSGKTAADIDAKLTATNGSDSVFWDQTNRRLVFRFPGLYGNPDYEAYIGEDSKEGHESGYELFFTGCSRWARSVFSNAGDQAHTVYSDDGHIGQWYDLEKGKFYAYEDDIPVISETDPTFSNAVLAVGINTNLVASIGELNDFIHGYGELGATSVGGIILALLGAAAFLKKKTALLENDGKATDTFATDLLGKQVAIQKIDERLPIPISEKNASFTTESYKRFVVTVSGDMTVTLHTPTSVDAEIFECRFNGASLEADASITFAGATATTMDANCGTVTAGKVALMSAFWNGTTWDVNWKVEG